MIEGISTVASATPSASVRAPQGPTAPSEGVSFEKALGDVIGAAVNALFRQSCGALQV